MSELDSTIGQGKELFEAVGPVSHRKMFGGAGLYAEGVMFALIAEAEIFLKTDGAFAADLEARGSSPFVYEGKGRPMQMSYWRLPEEALDDPDIATDLARRALACAHRARA